MKKGRVEAVKNRHRRTKNILASVLFIISGYLSLKIIDFGFFSDALGVLFYIAGLYGFLCLFKKKDFIF